MENGTEVMMVNCFEAEKYEGRIWKTRSEPWVLGHGQEVVLLEGMSGGFATNCLREVDGRWVDKRDKYDMEV